MSDSEEDRVRKSESKRDKKEKKEKKDHKDKKDKKDHKEKKDKKEKKSSRDRNDSRDRKDKKERKNSKDKKDKKDRKKRDRSEEKKSKKDRSRDRSNSNDERPLRQSRRSEPKQSKSASRGRRRKSSPYSRTRFNFDSPPKAPAVNKDLLMNLSQLSLPPQINYMDPALVNPAMKPDLMQFFVQVQKNKEQQELKNSKTDRKLYIGNIPAGLTAQKTQLMLNGALKQLKINQEPTGDSCINVWISPEVGNFGFAEFRTPDEATRALNGLGTVALMGQPLKVGRPANYTQSASTTESMNFTTGFNPNGAFNVLNLTDPQKPAATVGSAGAAAVGVAGAAGPVVEPPKQPTSTAILNIRVQPPTRILVLNNMISEGELIIEEEFKQIEEDIREECAKHGRVAKISIPHPQEVDEKVKGSGRVFVEYETPEAARDARRDLNGRLFSNRTVQAQYFSEQEYLAGNLDYIVS